METLETRLKRLYGGDILDLATGSGQFVQILTEMLGGFDRIVGIDLSEKALRAAEKRFPGDNYSFLKMDCRNLTFAENSFDTVTISNSLHHLDDPVPVLREMRRVVKPDGIILVSEMVCDGLSEGQLTHVLLHHWWAAIDSLNGIVHRPTFSRQQIRDLLQPPGFRELEFFEWEEDEGDPKDPERLLQFHGITDDYLAKIPAGKEAVALAAQGRQLHERLDTIGILGATTLAAIGRK